MHFTLSGLRNALNFGLFGYVRKKLWPSEVEWVCVVCCEVWIALVSFVQHVGGCAQVQQALDASM